MSGDLTIPCSRDRHVWLRTWGWGPAGQVQLVTDDGPVCSVIYPINLRDVYL